MLVTFTRRAAREMTGRAQAAAGADLSGMAAGTFHSICQRILRSHGPMVGLPSAFTVLDAEDQADLVGLARDAALAGLETRPSLPKPAVIAGWAGLRLRLGGGRAEPAPGRPAGAARRDRGRL
jgi:DNA helicase II / ATP-dependent DNA helicase PcrA